MKEEGSVVDAFLYEVETIEENHHTPTVSPPLSIPSFQSLFLSTAALFRLYRGLLDGEAVFL